VKIISKKSSILVLMVLLFSSVFLFYFTNHIPNQLMNYDEQSEPTEYEKRAAFEAFFLENKQQIIDDIATENEEITIELGKGYEFIMTILLDDIELDDENRAIYFLTFELVLSEMHELFHTIATDIFEKANAPQFKLTVIFVDVNLVEIARDYYVIKILEVNDDELNEMDNE